VAVITGGGGERGIGRAICLRYADEGARVAVLDVDAEGARTVADEIIDAGGSALAIQCDVSDKAQCEAAAAQVAGEWGGRIDILVNNAAWIKGVDWRPFDEWGVEEWDRMLAVNLRGMWLSARAFVPAMKARGYGKIINVTSSTFWEGVGGFIHYASSKGGVIGFTRALGRELGEFGIRVNALAPGYTATGAQADHAAAHREFADGMRALRALSARDEVADDLAGPAFFLASEDSDFMTCQSILVDGGRSMW
jgi:3-oxoacyl-[acyl-carrier protein] reductase